MRTIVSLVVAGCLMAALTGCDEGDLAHRKSIAELNQKAATLMAQGDFAGAVARLEAARDLAPNSPLLQYNLAIAYQQANRQKEAVSALEAFIKANPGDAHYNDAVQTLAVLHQQLGDAALHPLGDDANSETASATAPEPTAQQKAVALQHYEQSLAALQELQKRTPPENQKLIIDNIDYVKKSIATARGEAPVAGESAAMAVQ